MLIRCGSKRILYTRSAELPGASSPSRPDTVQWRRIFVGTRYGSGPNSSVGIATRYGLDGPGIESRWGTRFSAPVHTGPGAHSASCTMGTGSFPGVKRPGRGVDHPPPSSAKVEERVDLYLHSTSGPSLPVTGWTLLILIYLLTAIGLSPSGSIYLHTNNT